MDSTTFQPLTPVRVVGAAILRHRTCLAAQRGRDKADALCWELPGGKVEAGESPRAALAREIEEELGVRIAVGPWLGQGTSTAHGRRIELDVYAALITCGSLTLHEHERCRWLTAGELHTLPWAAADVPLLPAIARLLGG